MMPCLRAALTLAAIGLTALSACETATPPPAVAAPEPAVGAATSRPSFSGVWAPLIHEDAGYRLPGPEKGDYQGLPLNEAGRAVGDAWDPTAQYDAESQCRPHTAVYMFRSPFKLEIMQSDNMTVIASESYEQIRTIYTDGRRHHPPGSAHTRMGNSIGWYEGDSLVAETTHLEAGYIRRNGAPHSEDAVLTERFWVHPREDGDILTILQIVDDPTYLTEPLVRSLSFKRMPSGTKLEPYPCVVLDFG